MPTLKMNPLEFIDLGMKTIVSVIENDFTVSEEEKQTAITVAMDKAGVKEHDGIYYIPTDVWDD